MPRGRPKKYATEAQRRAAKTAQDRKASRKRVVGRYFRLVIPALEGYPKDWNWDTPEIIALRACTVDLLVAKERSRGLKHYLVAVQRHLGTGLPHLDILMIYAKSIKNPLSRYDYLVKHGNMTRYRGVNAAILNYGRKEDPSPLGNLEPTQVIAESRVKNELYLMMQEAMLKRPFKFDAIEWLADNRLMAPAVRTNIFKTLRAIRIRQSLECNRRLTLRPGIRRITEELIQERLSEEELRIYHSWQGYQTIVDHINQVAQWGCRRPRKMSNLLLVGRPNTGKSTLAAEIAKHCATYPLGIKDGWFPHYQSGVYRLLIWDEFELRCYRYTDLLKLLQGAPMKLPQKGGHVQRADNQLIIMTTNLSLLRHVYNRFRDERDRETSMANLRARIREITIPEGHTLFMLIKLILPKDPQ